MRFLNERAGDRLTSQQIIKEDNIKRIFSLLNRGSEMSRAELGRVTGLSATTVSALVDELVKGGLVRETGFAPQSHSGRKAINLALNPSGRQIAVFSLNRWGVRYTLYDLGYDALETYFASHESDRYGGFDENAADPDPDAGDDYADIMEDILFNRSRLFDPDKAVGVCVSHPGIYVAGEGVFSLSALHISFTRRSMEELEKKLCLPLFFGNSSTCLAYAEKKRLDRAGEAVNDLIYLNVCEGVGAGIVANGEIFTGADNTAGEIGHVSIDYKGRECGCGGRGCLERYVNTDAIVDTVKRVTARKQVTRIIDMARDSYDNITLELIGKAYDEGVTEIVEALDDIAAMLFSAIYSAVCLTGIKRIVVGGGIERLGDGFLAKLRSFSTQNARHYLMRDAVLTYAPVGYKGDSLGIAQYFIDKAYAITPVRA